MVVLLSLTGSFLGGGPLWAVEQKQESPQLADGMCSPTALASLHLLNGNLPAFLKG